MAAMSIVTAERAVMAVILIVEDDVFIREIAEMMIQDWGHDTLAASDVDEALTFLRSPQHIDALFTDIYLKTVGPWRVRACPPGDQASAGIARALHDGKFRYRQNEGFVCRRHAVPSQSRTRNISSNNVSTDMLAA